MRCKAEIKIPPVGLEERIFNDILHMSFLAGIHVFKAFPAYTTTELRVRTKCSSFCSVSVELYL